VVGAKRGGGGRDSLPESSAGFVMVFVGKGVLRMYYARRSIRAWERSLTSLSGEGQQAQGKWGGEWDDGRITKLQRLE